MYSRAHANWVTVLLSEKHTVTLPVSMGETLCGGRSSPEALSSEQRPAAGKATVRGCANCSGWLEAKGSKWGRAALGGVLCYVSRCRLASLIWRRPRLLSFCCLAHCCSRADRTRWSLRQRRSDPLVPLREHAALGGILRYTSRCRSARCRISSDRTRWSPRASTLSLVASPVTPPLLSSDPLASPLLRYISRRCLAHYGSSLDRTRWSLRVSTLCRWRPPLDLSMLLSSLPQQLRPDTLVPQCEYAALGGITRYIS